MLINARCTVHAVQRVDALNHRCLRQRRARPCPRAGAVASGEQAGGGEGDSAGGFWVGSAKAAEQRDAIMACAHPSWQMRQQGSQVPHARRGMLFGTAQLDARLYALAGNMLCSRWRCTHDCQASLHGTQQPGQLNMK